MAFTWALWQVWIASPLPFLFGFGIFVDLPARGLHLAFGLLLGLLMFPSVWESATPWRNWITVGLGGIAFLVCSYGWFAYDGIVSRDGILLAVDILGIEMPFEAILGGGRHIIIAGSNQAKRRTPRSLSSAPYSCSTQFTANQCPTSFPIRVCRLNGLLAINGCPSEAVFGIPIDVSVSYVFLFVLFGAFMDKAGAGRFFLDLSFGLVGGYRGGPAKAAIMASGLTGTVSGSSIANTVTTGAFTIPLMKKMGFPAHKAGAIEVAASTNGQLMPPIMGASAFIIAEFIGISYYDVIVHAAIPAVISYCALFYISHLESAKLGITGIAKSEMPDVLATLKGGLQFLIPIAALIYLLLVERWSPGSAVFYAILLMCGIMFISSIVRALKEGRSIANGGAGGRHSDLPSDGIRGKKYGRSDRRRWSRPA